MENEIWKDVEEFENLYEISNFGRLRNKPRMVNSLIGNRGFRVTTSKIKPTQDNGKGYKQYYVQINKSQLQICNYGKNIQKTILDKIH